MRSRAGRGGALAAFLVLLLAVPASADPATCAWEWGGVPEDPPAPCDEPAPPTVVTPDATWPVELLAPTPVPVLEQASPVPATVTVESTGLTDEQETGLAYGLGFLIFFAAAGLWVKLRRT